MRFFTDMRNALNLSAELQKLRGDVELLRREVRETQSEWTDVLDKLRAREERERKRSKATVVAALGEGSSDSTGGARSGAAGGGDPKAALRARALEIINARRA